MNDLQRAFVKGGPGSGNFGHAGRPGEVGGSGSGGGTFYHGTTEDRARSILNEGLIPFKHFEFDIGARTSEVGTKGKVFISARRSSAELFANELRQVKGLKGTPAIVKINVPKGMKLYSDIANDFGIAPNFYKIGSVPAKYIESVSVLSGGKWKTLKKEASEELVFYVVGVLKEKELIIKVTTELTDWAYLDEQGQIILRPAVLKIMQSGGSLAYAILKVQGSFDVVNVRAVTAATKFCAELVTKANKQIKDAIRLYIADGIQHGKSMPTLARELRPIVGLNARQAQAVINYKSKLLSEGAPNINRKVASYTGSLNRDRATMIARTETARAQNIGYVEGLKEAGVKEVEFSAYEGCCQICEDKDGETYSVDIAGNIIPVHPQCRCAMLPVIQGI